MAPLDSGCWLVDHANAELSSSISEASRRVVVVTLAAEADAGLPAVEGRHRLRSVHSNATGSANCREIGRRSSEFRSDLQYYHYKYSWSLCIFHLATPAADFNNQVL
ncbi:hypothetical protein VTN49DRAFT_8075 [Thermomyces lanuginosus]|uniref:uncharacterized protein n=1 Tax=Thermomyces lanuginosus TaxID=5541 RepID=UPI0037436865